MKSSNRKDKYVVASGLLITAEKRYEMYLDDLTRSEAINDLVKKKTVIIQIVPLMSDPFLISIHITGKITVNTFEDNQRDTTADSIRSEIKEGERISRLHELGRREGTSLSF
jgi:hypothetical protein